MTLKLYILSQLNMQVETDLTMDTNYRIYTNRFINSSSYKVPNEHNFLFFFPTLKTDTSWLGQTLSARASSSWEVVTSAATHRLVFLDDISSNKVQAKGWLVVAMRDSNVQFLRSTACTPERCSQMLVIKLINVLHSQSYSSRILIHS